ncbi:MULTISPECIES: hypothetical protein [Dyella]|uniref:Transmembrane lipoprotein n=2 Tax=Dyella TaxID=231454 RepID=A0A4R0YW26_9GAMM|nr:MULTISPECIES: hypothetical protein [Dyella]TBR39697.1 hypothetical protein EYV96_05765 [Dyella terrae]TCI12721.1 hypothetical protein EZM97_05105 [Dyella soli]
MISRCLAGVLLGIPLAACTLALALHWMPNRGQDWLIPVLILFFPLWTTVMIASYMFRSGLRAWVVLGSSNIAVFALLWLSRHLAG